jgi:protein farnesyltransferase subunit beta
MQASETTNSNLSTFQGRVEELSSDEEIPTSEMEQTILSTEVPIPPLFTAQPPIQDDRVTITSQMQNETLAEVLPYLTEPEGDLNIFGISSLIRKKHARYLRHMLEGPFPRQFVAADATRPWMLYWALAGLSMLDVDVSEYRERWVSAFYYHVLILQSSDSDQGHIYVHTYAELDWRIWWWSRAIFTHCHKLCYRIESGHGRWRRSS